MYPGQIPGGRVMYLRRSRRVVFPGCVKHSTRTGADTIYASMSGAAPVPVPSVTQPYKTVRYRSRENPSSTGWVPPQRVTEGQERSTMPQGQGRPGRHRDTSAVQPRARRCQPRSARTRRLRAGSARKRPFFSSLPARNGWKSRRRPSVGK